MGIFSIFGKKRKDVLMHLDPETIKNNEIIKAQQQKIQAQEVQISNYLAKEKTIKEKQKERDKESEFNKKLKEQGLDLQANKYGKIVWLDNFFYDIYVRNKNKPGKPIFLRRINSHLELVDKHDEVILGKYGGLGIMEGGKLCIRDSDGNIISYGTKLNQILYKPDGFENMVKRGRFTIPVDKDGNWIEDIDYLEINEPLGIDDEFDEDTGRIRWAKVKADNVKKVIAKHMQEKNEALNELERQEGVNIQLKTELDDKERKLRLNESLVNEFETRLSKEQFIFEETKKRLADIQAQNTKLLELKSTHEEIIAKKDKIISDIIEKLEVQGKPLYELLDSKLKDDLQFYKGVLPEKVEIKQEAPPEPRQIAQPGEVIKK